MYQALATVAGLQRGRSEARETEPIGPVPVADVVATLPHLTPTVRAMAQLQLLTGMRPGEVCAIRSCNIDRSADVWVYRPPAHKISYRGRSKAVTLGPKARAILEPLLTDRKPDEHVFSPARSREERFTALRAQRETKVQPSHICRAKPASKLKHRPRSSFSTEGYSSAISRACKKAGVPH